MSDPILLLVKAIRLWARLLRTGDHELRALQQALLLELAGEAAQCRTFAEARTTLHHIIRYARYRGTRTEDLSDIPIQRRAATKINRGLDRLLAIVDHAARIRRLDLEIEWSPDVEPPPPLPLRSSDEVLRLVQVMRRWSAISRRQGRYRCNLLPNYMLAMAGAAATSADVAMAERNIREFLAQKRNTYGTAMGGTGGAPVRRAEQAIQGRIEDALRMGRTSATPL